jgi:hypothetical protein
VGTDLSVDALTVSEMMAVLNWQVGRILVLFGSDET